MSPKTTGYVRPEVYSLGFVCVYNSDHSVVIYSDTTNRNKIKINLLQTVFTSLTSKSHRWFLLVRLLRISL